MLEGFVWFENSQVAVNTNKVVDFVLTKENPPTLEFRMFQDNGRIIRDQADICNFLQNVARLDSMPDCFCVSHTTEAERACED